MRGIDWGFGVLQNVFFSEEAEKKKERKVTESRIICSFSIVEKVNPIRQLKKQTITLDEDRWLVFLSCMWKLSGLDGCW